MAQIVLTLDDEVLEQVLQRAFRKLCHDKLKFHYSI